MTYYFCVWYHRGLNLEIVRKDGKKGTGKDKE